jgi:hypothetical protein
MSDNPHHGSVTVRTEDGEFELIENVADVAEVSPGRLQVVLMDQSATIVSGTLFAGWGMWKLWLDCNREKLEKYEVRSPCTMPGGHIKFRTNHGIRTHGRTMKRLKRPDI